MANTQTLSHARFSKTFLPSMRGGVTGIQPSPLCRGGTEAGITQQGREDKRELTLRGELAKRPTYSSLTWVDPTLFFDQGQYSVRTPQTDLGLHFSSVDQWLLADLDFGFDDLDDSALQVFSPQLEACSQYQVFRESSQSMKSTKAGKTAPRGKDLASLSVAANLQGKRKRAEAQLEVQSNLVVDDVRAIFHAVQGNFRPPKGLHFQVVLGTVGQKISPPSFEFESEFEMRMKILLGNFQIHTFLQTVSTS